MHNKCNTNSFLISLATNLPNLQKLSIVNFSANPQITPEGVLALQNSKPNLIITQKYDDDNYDNFYDDENEED